MRKQALGLASALLLVAFQAQAQSEYGGEIAPYLALSGVYNLDTSSGDVNDEVTHDNSWGISARAGFRLTPGAAIELQGDYDHAWHKLDLFTMTVNFRAYPMQMEMFGGEVGPLQPYVVAGAGVIGGDPKNDPYQLNGAFRMGLGCDFYLTEQLALDVGGEWLAGTGHWSDASHFALGAGLQYNF